MDTVCQRCGHKGFANAFVYCAKCPDVAVHRECLNVRPEKLNEFGRWVCADCQMKVVNQSESSKKKSREEGKYSNDQLMLNSRTFAEPIVMPIWRGSFDIRDKKHGVVAHLSSKACKEVYDEASRFQSVIHLEMIPKSYVWPKSFKKTEMAGENIALFFFPTETSEFTFGPLVDEMMQKELALRGVVQNAELLVFTSRELPQLYSRFQGKYYLWGVFRQKHQAPSHPHSCKVESGEDPVKHADLRNDTGSDGALDATPIERRGRRLNNGWEHAKLLDKLRQKSECKYCGFISTHGGISRLKAHLGGGNKRIHLPGCDKVPPDVKEIMAEWFTEWVKNTKALWTKGIQGASFGDYKRDRPLDDDIWEHAIPLDELREGAKCKYCNFVSVRSGIECVKAHLSGGDPTRQIQSCLNVSPEVKILMAKGIKKSSKRKKDSSVKELVRTRKEVHGVQDRYHFEKPMEEMTSDSPKASIRKIIDENKVNIAKMRLENQLLENQLDSMP